MATRREQLLAQYRNFLGGDLPRRLRRFNQERDNEAPVTTPTTPTTPATPAPTTEPTPPVVTPPVTAPVSTLPPGTPPLFAPTTIPGGTGNIIENLPAARGTSSGQSRIDPALMPYLGIALRRAEQLFLGENQPTLYPGQMYVSPSEQTLAALAQQEQLAGGASPALQQAQQSYLQSLGQIGQTAGGGFLEGSPYRDAMIAAATRPLTQQFESQVVPGISSLYSRAGRYGSGSMERALGQATEAYGRALGDVTSTIAGQDYARERGLQQQAQIAQSALAQAAPSFFQMGFLPAQALAQVGASREQIAAQPLQEAMQRYQFSQQLPYQQLQGFLGSVYGTPMGSSQYPAPQQAQTNRLGSAIGGAGLGYMAGQALGFNPVYGAIGGGLLGGLL